MKPNFYILNPGPGRVLFYGKCRPSTWQNSRRHARSGASELTVLGHVTQYGQPPQTGISDVRRPRSVGSVRGIKIRCTMRRPSPAGILCRVEGARKSGRHIRSSDKVVQNLGEQLQFVDAQVDLYCAMLALRCAVSAKEFT